MSGRRYKNGQVVAWQKRKRALSRTTAMNAQDWLDIIAAYDEGTVSMNMLAEKSGLPRSTLQRRLHKRDSRRTVEAVGRPAAFTLAQEKKIVGHVLYLNDAGCGVTTGKLCSAVKHAAAAAGYEGPLGGPRHIRNMLARTGTARPRKPKYRNQGRAVGFNRVVTATWFLAMRRKFEKFKPEETYNADPTFFNSEEMLPQKVRQFASARPGGLQSHTSAVCAGAGPQGRRCAGRGAEGARRPPRADGLR
jgi:hypothetical protein